MKHWLWLALVSLLLAAPWASTSPTEPKKPGQDVKLPPYGVQLFLIPCDGGGERTSAVVATTSREQAVLGLYAYDSYGNCIAHDEFDEIAKGRPAFDQVAVAWFPPTPATYTVEVRNTSASPCTIQYAIR